MRMCKYVYIQYIYTVHIIHRCCVLYIQMCMHVHKVFSTHLWTQSYETRVETEDSFKRNPTEMSKAPYILL